MRRIKASTRLVQLVLSLAICSATAAGRTIYVDQDAKGDNTGTSWTHAYRSLQDALSAASSGDQIRVAQGTYRPDQGDHILADDRDATFELSSGVTIKGGYAGYGQLIPDARNINLFATILTGDLNDDDGPDFANRSDNSYHVITSSGTDDTTVLDGFTITGGNAAGDLSEECGGGMYNNSGSPTLRNCSFEDNRAADSGGGMYNAYGASPTLVDCAFSSNAAGVGGGGMANVQDCNPILQDCVLTGNFGQYGGGMYNLRNCSPALTDCALTDNEADLYGGGMYNYDGCSLSLTNCTFSGNFVDGYGSAGVHNDDNCNCTLTDCTFRNNSARAWGGGFTNLSSDPVLTGCTFINNFAGHGGGGMINANGGYPVVQGCTFIGNSSKRGAGMRDEASATLYNCLFSDNSADYGGGMYLYNAQSTLANCTIVGNSATNGNAFAFDSFDHSQPSSIGVINSILWDGGNEFWNNDGSTISVTYSDVYDGWPGEGNIFADPLFINGGDDYHLASNSPCIDTGDPSSDYSQEPQPNGDRVNMGRYGNTPEASSKAEPQIVIVPNVVGMTKSNAATDIIAAGLAVGPETSEHSETVPKRYIISQDPAAGTEVAGGTRVNLVVSLGPPPDKATVTVSSSAGGFVSNPGEGAFEYDRGSLVAIKAVAESNHRFVSWTGTGVDAGKVGDPQSANTTVTVDADYTLKANFAEDIQKVTLLLMSTVGGSVSSPGEGSFQYDPGSIVPIEATAEAHHYFVGWAGTAVDAGKVADPNAASTTVTADSDYTLRAHFALDQDEVLLTISSTEGGSVITPGEGDFRYERGSTVSVAALSQSGSKFMGWTGSAVAADKVADPNKASTTVFVDSDYTLQANFYIEPVELIISSTTGGTVSLPGEGIFLYDPGTIVPINAVAQTGYSFIGWSGTAADAGMVANPSGRNTTVTVGNDYSLQANFTPVDNKVTLVTSSTSGGQVWVPGEGSFEYRPGSVISIEAITEPNYVFAGWTGTAAEAGKVADSGAAKTTVTIDADYTLNAKFILWTNVVYVDANAAGYNDGSSWTDAFLHLQDALAAVRPGDEIHVAQGTYRPDEGRGYYTGDREATFDLLDDVTIKGGYAGCTEPDPNARDISGYETILSGDLNGDDGPALTNMNDNSYHVVTCKGTDASAVLDGVTITAGNADAMYGQRSGGGIYNANSSPTLRNCTLWQNRAGYRGGAMFNDSDSSPTLTNCTFKTNEAEYGGAMANGKSSSPTLVNCTFLCNRAKQYGGGMYNYFESRPTLTNCTFTGNSAENCNSGAMHNNSNSGATLTNCTFNHNTAADWAGAIGNHHSHLLLTNCSFIGNRAVNGAGAMANGDDANSVFINCTFVGNSAGRAGAIQNRGALTLVNCRLSGNRARDYGGGICSRDESTQTLVNCTLSGNLAPDGSAIACSSYEPTDQSEVQLTNCILWDLGPEIWSNNSSVISASYSNIRGGWPGPGQLDNDPCFVEIGYWDPNGTDENPTDDFWVDGDYHLGMNSPCIDAGTNEAVPADSTDLDADGDVAERTPTDLDCSPRFIDDPLTADTGIADPPYYPDVVDMGAYEFLGAGAWHTVTPSAGGNGSITPTDPVTVLTGGEQQFTAQPNTNYHIETWYVDGDVVQSGGATYVLHDVQADHTVHVTFGFNEPAVPFADPNLQAAVEEELGTSDPTVPQMGALAYLDACDMGINNLTGLQFAELLAVLLLDNNQITNISVLQYLSRLTTLSLYNNNISNIAPIADLKKLEYLDLRANPLNEDALSVYIPQIMANNPGLILLFDAPPEPHTLTVSSTSGGSVVSPGEGPFQYDHGSEVTVTAAAAAGSEFAGWTGTAVYAGMVADPNAVSTTVTMQADYTLKANFTHNAVHFADTNLKAAVEEELGITNPTPTEMTHLTKLQAYNKGIVDLTGLEHATQMHTLYLDGNNIADISTLLNLKNLRLLSLLNNDISDISALAHHKKLRLLNLRGNPLNIDAYVTYIPEIRANNPRVRIFTDRR